MHATWDEVRDRLAESFPKIGPLMDDAMVEVMQGAYTGALVALKEQLES